MKFATISTYHATQPALVKEDRVYTLPYPHMLAVMAAGAEKAASKASTDSFALDEVKFHSPIHPITLRDGYAFEQHVKTANKNRGREVPEEWYQFPVFYFTNPNAVFGEDRKSTRLNSSHSQISYAVFCFKKKKSSSHRTSVFRTST